MAQQKKKCPSKGKVCLGVFRSTLKCARARDKSGLPIVLNKDCAHCGEQRCRAHCKCGRDESKKARGRSAPRGHFGKSACPAPALPASIPPPVGRASVPSCTLLATGAWYTELGNALASASEVQLASYMYDNATVQSLLFKRLQGRSDFQLDVYIDSEIFAGSNPRCQKPRLRALRSAGARIHICKGGGPQGSFHAKAVVIDRRYLYTGSANLTQKSHNNEELCFKVTGPAVLQVLARLAEQRQKGKLWKDA